MSTYLPTLYNLMEAAGVILTVALFVALGAVATVRRGQPEVALVAGWGLVCVVLTTWGTMTSSSLRFPLAGLAVAGVGCLAFTGCRQRFASLDGTGRLLLLTLPMWLVMLPLRPSQLDTWLNLLPNAAYLFDFDEFPTALTAPSYSFLPVAPYNTQFAAYVASVVSGGFADGAMALFNIALQCAAALLLARVVSRRDGAPPWWACAAGLLLIVPLNPGFVPRVFFSSYGEAPLAVTALFAVWLSVTLIEELAQGASRPASAPALALVLAALVNIKQSGIGLLLPVGVSLLALVLLHPRIRSGRGCVVVAATLVPGLGLYLMWRVFVANSGFVAGELQPLPFAAWNFPLLPEILASIARTMFQKATYFACMAVVLIAWVPAFRRDRWSREALLLGMIAGVTALFNLFLIFTYIAHFPSPGASQAHSYFRYATQLSLLVMLGLVVALRPAVARWMVGHTRLAAHGRVTALILSLILPLALVRPLRFDLEAPQAELWTLVNQAKRDIPPATRLAVVVPGDVFDSVGSAFRGVLMFTPPRRTGLDVKTVSTADAAMLNALATSGYHLALVSCTPSGLDAVPAHEVALLRYADGRWQVQDAWPYSAGLKQRHFAALLAHGPFCAARPSD